MNESNQSINPRVLADGWPDGWMMDGWICKEEPGTRELRVGRLCNETRPQKLFIIQWHFNV